MSAYAAKGHLPAGSWVLAGNEFVEQIRWFFSREFSKKCSFFTLLTYFYAFSPMLLWPCLGIVASTFTRSSADAEKPHS